MSMQTIFGWLSRIIHHLKFTSFLIKPFPSPPDFLLLQHKTHQKIIQNSWVLPRWNPQKWAKSSWIPSPQEWWEVRAPGGLPLRAGPSLTAEVVGEVLRQPRIQVGVGCVYGEWMDRSKLYIPNHAWYIYIYVINCNHIYIYVCVYVYMISVI